MIEMMKPDRPTKVEDVVLHSIALTKLDILDDQPIVKIGVAYLINGQKIDYYPGMGEYLVICRFIVSRWLGACFSKIFRFILRLLHCHQQLLQLVR